MVSKYGLPLGLDGWCVGHAYISVKYVFFMLWTMCFLCMHGGGHCCRCFAMWKLMMLLLGSIVMNACEIYMHLLCISMSIPCYAFIVMVIVVVREVILGILGNHDVVGMS